ncbi:MAG: HAD hydrolase-like protein [Bacteroidota bacterium]
MSKKTVLLDVDGVIFDSNWVKEHNIIDAAKHFLPEKEALQFGEYFSSLNGIPRGLKTRNYFEDQSLANQILATYNRLNKESLKNFQFTEKAFETLQQLSNDYDLVALSGAEHAELLELFSHKGISDYFQSVFGGPATKIENLKSYDLTSTICFVGDSKTDHEVAEEYNLPFIFMSGYTQFQNWESYFDQFPEVKKIAFISSLPHTISS